LTPEQKIERAKELIDKKRKEKQEEEEQARKLLLLLYFQMKIFDTSANENSRAKDLHVFSYKPINVASLSSVMFWFSWPLDTSSTFSLWQD
jgi:hypothetical protein